MHAPSTEEIRDTLASGLSYRAAAAQLGISKDKIFRTVRDGSTGTPKGHVVKGVSTLYDAEGNVKAEWVKTREGPSAADIIEEIKAGLVDCRKARVFANPKSTLADLASVYLCADWHFGLLAWQRETGVSYDLEIAEKLIGESISSLVEATPRASQAVVLGLGDLLHVDGYAAETPASKHRLDADGRWPKTLRIATMTMAKTIERALTKHETVLVRILRGNHDPQSAIAVSLALSLYFRENTRVTVDDDPSYYWWWRFGNTFLGATHGDKAKMADLPLIMAAERPEWWGATRYRSIYTGHIHTQTGIEKNGVTVESFRTPAARDAWHHEQGYRAGRSITSITHTKDRGEFSRQRVNIL